MIDWTMGMRQTYEFREVDPGTWRDIRVMGEVTSAEIDTDDTLETKGYAKFEAGEGVGECYIRTYIVCEQDGETETHCLGTHLAQTLPAEHDGKSKSVNIEAYTPLIELKEKPMPVCYSIPAGANIAEMVESIAADNCRAPVDSCPGGDVLSEPFTAQTDWTCLDYLSKLAAKAGRTLMPSPEGRITQVPMREAASLAPVFAFDDGNASITLPDIADECDYYGVPNVVEVVWSGPSGCVTARAVNDDPESPLSVQARGREIPFRDTSPNLEDPTQEEAQEYAEAMLRKKSHLLHTVKFTHGFVPHVRKGDCVRLDFDRAGVHTLAVVTAQKAKCETGCTIEATAVYTEVIA